MLTVIMQRLTALEQSGEMGRKMDAFKERVIRNSLRPPAVPGIGRTEKYGSRLFDPSVRLAADIRDNEGRVFARQGEVMNPLQYVPLTRRCISSMAMIRRRWLDETPDAAHTGEQNYPRAGQYPGDAEVSGQPCLL